jgi:hypothetical protein
MDRSLSGEEIMKLCGGKIKVLPYPAVSSFDNIDDLLEPYGRVAILYMSRPRFGHWVLLHKLKNGVIELFDSYGLCIDDELDYIDKRFRQQSNQLRKHLTRLLIQHKYKVAYNDHPLQAVAKGVSTCGRWVVCRALNADVGTDAFARRIRGAAKRCKLTPDQLVCQLVEV